MKKINQIYSILSAIILLALSGCAHYRPKCLLSNINTNVITNTKESTISFDHHIFSKSDCKKYLDRNIIETGYQPVLITLTNNTKNKISISVKNFSFNCTPATEVAQKAHTNTKARAVGYGVASLCVPILWIPVLWIPAVVDVVGSSSANKKLDADFSHKALNDQIVNQFSTISGLIFVPINSFNPNFSFCITDLKTNKKYTLKSNNPVLNI